MQEQNISAAEIHRRYEISLRQLERQRAAENGEGDENGENNNNENDDEVEEAIDSVTAVSSSAVQAEPPSENIETLEPKRKRKASKASKSKAKRKKPAKIEDDEDLAAENDGLERPKIKRRNFKGSDSESDSDSDSDASVSSLTRLYNDAENNEELFRQTHSGKGRIPGEVDFCASCHCKFTVTMTSETAPMELQTDQEHPFLLLCAPCSKDLRDKGKQKMREGMTKDALTHARQQRKKVAAALLDRKEFSVPTLSEMCIQLVSQHIDDVETLGDIGANNQDKLARILSRNRYLNSKTMKLFLDPAAKSLQLWDCSEINQASLGLIPAYCPQLEVLTLSMCGQLNNEILAYCAANLPNLRELALDGAFLISTSAWAEFFLSTAGRLRKLDLRNTHRFESEALAVLVESQPQLEHLTLQRMAGLTDPAAFLMLPSLTNLTHLELSHPPQELVMGGEVDLITDETLTLILNAVGAQLQSLVLDGCSELSDAFITNALRPCCCGNRLTRLSLSGLDRITDAAVADLFSAWQDRHDRNATRLAYVNFDRCFSLGDSAFAALLDYTRLTAIELSFTGIPDVSSAPFREAFSVDDEFGYVDHKFPVLNTVKASFVRAFDNDIVQALVKCAPVLEYVEVFGVPKVNRNCVIRNGVKLIGRQDEM